MFLQKTILGSGTINDEPVWQPSQFIVNPLHNLIFFLQQKQQLGQLAETKMLPALYPKACKLQGEFDRKTNFSRELSLKVVSELAIEWKSKNDETLVESGKDVEVSNLDVKPHFIMYTKL